MKGLLLAGGHGTRLRPLTFTGNKHMIPIANTPMVFYGLRHLAEGGISEVGIILGPLHEGLEEAIGDGTSFGLRVTYIHQGEPKGLAHAVLCAREFLANDPFVMYLGDNLLQEGTRGFVAQYNEGEFDAVIGVSRIPHPESYGVVEMEGDRIVSIVEKPSVPRSDLALIGVYLFSPSIHPIIQELKPSKRGELEITDAIWKLHEAGKRIAVRRVQGWWKDTGRPEDLLEANDRVLETLPSDRFTLAGTVERGAQLTGHVGVGAGSFVGSRARIDGPTLIGRDVRVDGTAHIGPGTAVGDHCVIRDSSVQRGIIMERTEIDGPIDLRDSIVGRSARIRAEPGKRIRISCVLGDSTQLRL
jgi:glucose-1-phosphate thymidylyltransferase